MSDSQSTRPTFPHLSSASEEEMNSSTNQPAQLNAEERSPNLFTSRIPLPSSGTNRSFPPGESASARLNQDRANATHPAAPVFDRDQTRKSLQDNPFQRFTQPLSSSASHPEHHRIKEPSLYESARPPLPPVPTWTSSRDSASNWPNIKHNSTHSDREIPSNPRVHPGNEDNDGNLRTSFDRQFGASEAHGETDQHGRFTPEESFPQQKNVKWSPQQVGKFPRRVDRSTSTFSRSGQYSEFAGDTSFTHPASGLEASQEHSYSQEIPPFEANVSPSTRGTPPLDSPSRASQPEHQESHVVGDAPPHLTVPHEFYHFPPYSSLADKHTSQPSDLPPEEPSPDHSSEEISADGHAAHQSVLSAAPRDTRRKFFFNPDSIAPRTASSSDNTTVATGVFASSTDPFGTAETRLAPPQLHSVNVLGEQASTPVEQLMEPQPDVTTLPFESYNVNSHGPDRSTSADNSSESSVSKRNQGHTEPFNVSTEYSSGSESQEAVGTYNEGPSTEKFPWNASRNPPEKSERTNISGPLGREPPVNPNILVATEKEDPPEASFFRRSPYTLSTKPYLASPYETDRETSDQASETGVLDSPRPRSIVEPEEKLGSKGASSSAELDSNSEVSSHGGHELGTENVLDEEEFMPPSHPSIAFDNESEPSISDEEMDYSHVGDPPTTNLSTITELSEPSPEAHFPHSLPRSPLSQTWPAQQSAPIPEESDVEELTAEQNEPTPEAYLTHSLPRPPLSQTRPNQPSAPIPEESDLDELTAVQDSAAGAKISGVHQPLGFVVTGSIPSDIIGFKSQPADPIQSHKSMSHLADRKSGPSYRTEEATATRIGPKKVVIPHGYLSPAEPEDSEQGDDSQSHPDDEEPTAVAPELDPSPATEKFDTISTQIFTAPYLSSPAGISHVTQESEVRSPTSQIDFQSKTSLPSGNNSDLPPEPLDAPGFADKPIHPDLPRSEHAAIESREVKTNVSPGAAAHELKEPPVTTPDQSEDFISTYVASNPSVYLQPQRSEIEADTPAPETISSAAYSGRDEIGERFTAVPKRGPSSEDFDSDGVDDPATAPEGTHLAIPRNRLQMAEHEDWSEGNSSEAETSEPRPAGYSIGHFAAELSSPLEATDDNGPVQRQDATTGSYAGPEETPTSSLEPSISRSIGWDDIAEPENRTSISLRPNPLTEIVAPIAKASDDASFQASTTPDLTGRNEVPLEGLMSPTADASFALLESKAAIDESESDVANAKEAPEVDPTDLVEPLVARQLDSTSKKRDPVFDKPYVAIREEEPEVLPAHAVEQPVVQEREELAPTSDAELDPVFDESYVSNSEEEPEFLPDHAVEQSVVEDRDSNSDAIFDSAGHTQDTEAGTQHYPEPATATITDANLAESEGTVEAEPLPRDTGVVHNIRPISPEAEGSSDGEQSASLLTETAAGPSHEHTGLAKAVAASQVANEAEPVLARSAPSSNEGEADIPTAAHSDSTETGASSIPANLSPERQASDDGSVNDVQDNACAADAGPETTLISEYLANPTPHTHASESSSSEDDLDVSHTLDASLTHPSNATELPMSASDAHLFDLQPSRAVRPDVQIQAASPSENDLAVDSEQLTESVLTEPAANDVERDSDAGRIPPELPTDEILGDAASGAEERHAATSNQSDQLSSFAAPPILPVDTAHPDEWHTEDDERYTEEDERHTEEDERHTEEDEGHTGHTEKDERHTEKDERRTEEDERHTEDATPAPVPTSWATHSDRDESVEGSEAVTGTESSGQGYESNVVVAPVPVPRESSSGTPSNQPQMAEKKGLEEEGSFGLPQGETSNVDLAATSPVETPTGLSHELEAVNQDTDNQPHDTPHASGITPTPKELTSSEPESAPSLTTKSADAVQRKVEESFSLEAIPQAEDAVPIAKTFGDSLVQVPPTQESPAQDARPLEELVDLTPGSGSAQLEEMVMTDPSISDDATREQEPEVPSTEPIEQIVAREVVSTPDETHEPVVDTQESTAEPQETAEAATYSILDANPAQADGPIEVEMLPTATDIMQNIDVDMQEAGYSSSNEQLVSVSTETAAGPSIQDPEVIETVSESHGTNEKGQVEPSLVSDEVTNKVDHPATAHKDENSNEHAATDFQEPSSSPPEEPHASSDMAVDIQQEETDSQASTVQTPEMPQDRSPAPSETEGHVGESVAVSDDSATEPDSSPAVISEVTPAVDIHASAEVGPVSHEDSLALKQPQATAEETAADSTDVQTVPDKTGEPSIDASSAGSATEDINPALVNVAVDNEPVVAPIDEAPATGEPAPIEAHVISEPELQTEETHLPRNELALNAEHELALDAEHELALDTEHELALDAEQLTETLVTGEPTPEDTNRVDDSASESQEVHTDELPREAASGLEQHTTTPSQSEEPSSVAATPTTPVDTAHSDQRQAEAETPGPKTPTSGSHSDRDENAEQSAVVPEKLPSPEDSESDVLDEFATVPEGAAHAAPHNQPQMGEKEKPSEGTSLSSAPSKDENLNAVPIDASADQLPPDSSQEPESQVDDVTHPSAGTDVAGTTPLESNQPSESMVPLVETPDHLVQDSATEDHIAQNAAPPAEAVDTTVDSSSTQLEKTAITESSTSDVASGEKAPEVPLPDPTEQLVAQEPTDISDVNPETAADTEDAKGEPQDTLEVVTATAVDANPVQPEATIEAELLPTDSDAATEPATISQEPEGSSDTQQPVSVPKETAADSSTEDSAIEKAAVPQVINEQESVDASTVPANEGTADQSNEAAEAAVADSGEPTQPTTETSDSPESHVDRTEGENTSTDSTDKPNASSAIDSSTIPAIDVEATTAAADESGKPAEDPAMESRELGELNPPATTEESEKAIEGAVIQSEDPPPPPLDVKEDSSKPVADIQHTEPESLVTSEQTPDSAQDPNPGQPEGQGNAADGMEASADTNAKPEASADDSPVIPTADVDPPTATDDDKKPTPDVVVESGEAGELNHAATADESEQATEVTATTSEEPASAPPEIIQESPETVADAQPTEGGSQVVSEPTPDSTKDPSPESPESLGNEVESLEASGDSTVQSDAAVESSPAPPAGDADPTPTADGGEKPIEDAVVQSDDSSEANLATIAGETEQIAEALDTTSKEPAPASPQVTADSPETVAVIQQTEAEPNVVSEPTTDPAKDLNPPPPEGQVNEADDVEVTGHANVNSDVSPAVESSAIPVVDVDVPPNADEGEKPAEDALVQSDKPGEANLLESEQVAEGAATISEEPAAPPSEALDSANDASLPPPESQAHGAEGAETPGDSAVNPEVSSEVDSPAAPAVEANAPTPADEGLKSTEDAATNSDEPREANPSSADERQADAEGAAPNPEELAPPQPEEIEKSPEAVADAPQTEGDSQVTSGQPSDPTEDPSHAQPEGEGNPTECLEASADSTGNPDASPAESSPATPAVDVDPPAADDAEKPTDDPVVQSDEPGEVNLPTTADVSGQATEIAATNSEEPAPAAAGAIEESPVTVAEAQQTGGDSPVVPEQVLDAAQDPSAVQPESQTTGEDLEAPVDSTQHPAEDPNPPPLESQDGGAESSSDPNVNLDDSAAVDSPATPAADNNTATTPGEPEQPTEETAIKSEEPVEVNLSNTADESGKATEGAVTNSEEPPPPQPEVIDDSSKTVADVQQTEGEPQVASEQTPDPAHDPSPELPEGQGNEADKLEASGDSTAKPDGSVDDSPVPPAVDTDPPTTGDEGEKPTEDVTATSVEPSAPPADDSNDLVEKAKDIPQTEANSEPTAEQTSVTPEDPNPATPGNEGQGLEKTEDLAETTAEPDNSPVVISQVTPAIEVTQPSEVDPNAPEDSPSAEQPQATADETANSTDHSPEGKNVPTAAEEQPPSEDPTIGLAVPETPQPDAVPPEEQSTGVNSEKLQPDPTSAENAKSDTDSVPKLAEKKIGNDLLKTALTNAAVDKKPVSVPKSIFTSYLPAFLDSPPPSSTSVPKPPFDPAVTTKVWPGAPAVSNIQREIIVPARMKKISTVSTSSKRTLFMNDLTTYTLPLSQPPTPKPALNSDTSQVTATQGPSTTPPCVPKPQPQHIPSSPPARVKSMNIRHKLLKPYPSLKRMRATDSPDHRAWRSSYQSITFRNKNAPSATDQAGEVSRAKSIKLGEFGLRPRSQKRRSTRLEQNNDLSDAFAIIEMSDATTYSPMADRYVNPTLSRRLSTSVRDIIQKRHNRRILNKSPLDDVYIAEDFHLDVDKELALISESRSEDDPELVEVGTAGPSVPRENRDREVQNTRKSVDSKHTTKGSVLSDDLKGKKQHRIKSKLADATISITEKIIGN